MGCGDACCLPWRQKKAKAQNDTKERSKTPEQVEREKKAKNFLSEQRRQWTNEPSSPSNKGAATPDTDAKSPSSATSTTPGATPTSASFQEASKTKKADEVRPPWLDWYHYDESNTDETLLGALVNQEVVVCMDELTELNDKQVGKIAEAVGNSKSLQKLQFAKAFVLSFVKEGRGMILNQLWQAVNRSCRLTLLTLADEQSSVVGKVGPDADPAMQLRCHRTLEEIRFKDDKFIQIVPMEDVLNKMGPVHSAIWRDNQAALRNALEKDPQGAVQPARQDKLPPLNRAAWLGRKACVGILLDQFQAMGFDEAAVAPYLSVALASSAGNRHTEVVQHLVERRANPNQPSADGWPPLVYAAQWGAHDAVQVLLKGGASPDQRTPQGSTAAMHATVTGQVAILRRLADARADLGAADQGGLTALMMAAQAGRMDTLKVLLDAGTRCGVDLQAKSKAGATAAALAALKGQAAVVSLLLDARADPDPVVEASQRYGRTAILDLLAARGVVIPPAQQENAETSPGLK
mmetsp:Transcript_20649/g.36772  ORF Transcript_20649/g.36772 Transcript_20649/m.36772 type:complete len:521 (+) Transcript_20649:66-1628(+)